MFRPGRGLDLRDPTYAWRMIPRVKPEGRLFRKPVPSPDHVRARLFRDHALMRGDAGADLAAHAGPAQAAIAGRVLREVLLVVILGKIERRRIEDFRRDRAKPLGAQRLLVHGPRRFGSLALLGREHVDARAILRADIVALAHALGRVMILPERLQQLL